MRYRNSPKTMNIAEMEENMVAYLDDVPLLQIQQWELPFLEFASADTLLIRYANRSARFISAYLQGLNGPKAVWANWKYHGYRILPASIIAELKAEFPKK